MSTRRTIGLAVLLLLLALPAHAGPKQRKSSFLYVRGAKDLPAILTIVRQDLSRVATEKPFLLVVLVDPAHRTARPMAKLGPVLAGMTEGAPEGSRVLVAAVDGEFPSLAKPQDLETACLTIAEQPVGGVRNLLGDVRMVVRKCRHWDGPRHLLLLAMSGVSVEEETETTLRALRKHRFTFSVVTGEAAFSQPWKASPPRPPEFVFRETGHPDRRAATVYPASETPFPDTPAAFDLDLAPGRFRLTPEHKRTTDPYALPSGFGYYHLARLARATGGRYYLHGFVSGAGGGFTISYEYGFLRLFGPDLRDRAEILAEIPRHVLARTLYEVWGHLAEPRIGVIRRRPPVDVAGGRIHASGEGEVKPNRALRLSFQSRGESAGMGDVLAKRHEAVEAAIKRINAAMVRYKKGTGGRVHLGDHRWMAQLGLLRLQCLRVRFHMAQIASVLREVKGMDFRNVTISLRARPLYRGSRAVPKAEMPDDPRLARYLEEVVDETLRMEETYAGTPWGYAARCGELHRWIVATTPKGVSRPIARSGPDEPARPAPKPKKRTGQPSSSGSGQTTGGGD